MRPRDDSGHFLAWEDALELRYDPDAVSDAVAGEQWAAWLLDVLEWEEDTGVDPEQFDDLDEFLDVAEAVAGAEDYDEEWDAGDEFEISAESDRYTEEG